MNPQQTTFIYGLWDPRDYQLRYIGKSDNPEERLKQHIFFARHGSKSHKDTWIRSLLKQKLEPCFEILEVVFDYEWEDKEKIWIDECKIFGLKLTNTTEGGKGGRGGKGQPLSKEHKRKIGLANSGKKPSQEAISKRLEKMKGYCHSEETRKKISECIKKSYQEGNRKSTKGRIQSDEERKKRAESQKGHIVTEETKKKISNANKGRKYSEEIVEAMRERGKRAWEQRKAKLNG